MGVQMAMRWQWVDWFLRCASNSCWTDVYPQDMISKGIVVIDIGYSESNWCTIVFNFTVILPLSWWPILIMTSLFGVTTRDGWECTQKWHCFELVRYMNNSDFIPWNNHQNVGLPQQSWGKLTLSNIDMEKHVPFGKLSTFLAGLSDLC